MGRTIVLVYGALAYLAFLAAFLYAVGFVGDIIVPKSIDTGLVAPFARALVADLVLLTLFAGQHSAMARPGFKRWWTKIIPQAAERSTYVLISSLLLALIYWQWRPITTVVWKLDGPAALVVEALFWLGWLLVLVSSFAIDHFDLFGLHQVYLNFRSARYVPLEFKVGGLYRRLRHPIMAGFIVAFWAAPLMTVGHLVFALATTGYIALGTMFEERDLIAFYGEPYREYRRRIWAVLPITSVDRSFGTRHPQAVRTAQKS